MTRIYVRTFASIARDFGLWVNAGSGLFPRNRLDAGSEELVPASAKIFNTSYTFSPSGEVAAITRKVNLVPTQEDVLGLSAAAVDELQVVDTPLGRLGTLICYDGFHEPHTSREPKWQPCASELDRLGATVVAQPSANAWAWDEPWVFNDPGENLLRSEQWFAEGLASSLGDLQHIRYAVNAQLVGQVLDNTFEAPSLVLERCGSHVCELARSADPRGEDVLHVRVEQP